MCDNIQKNAKPEKTDPHKRLADLEEEHQRILKQIQSESITDEQIEQIGIYAAGIRDSLENIDFVTVRRIIDLLDVHGTLAGEEAKKAVQIHAKPIYHSDRASKYCIYQILGEQRS